MSRFALYLFDLDGTLVDTLDVWGQMTKTFLAEFGLTATDEEIEAMDHMSFAEGSRHLREVLGVPLTEKEFGAKWLEVAARLYEREARIFPNARETLVALKAAGAQLALFSQSPRELVQNTLERMNLWPLFDAFFLAGETKADKGDKQAVTETADRMGVPVDQVAVIEDAPYAARAAKEAGAFVYGMGYMNKKRDKLASYVDQLIDDLIEIN